MDKMFKGMIRPNNSPYNSSIQVVSIKALRWYMETKIGCKLYKIKRNNCIRFISNT